MVSIKQYRVLTENIAQNISHLLDQRFADGDLPANQNQQMITTPSAQVDGQLMKLENQTGELLAANLVRADIVAQTLVSQMG